MSFPGITCDRPVICDQLGVSGPSIRPMTGRDVYGRPPARRPRAQTGISRRSLLGLRLTASARRDIDWDALTARVRQGWQREGHGPFLRALEPAARVLTELAGVGPGTRVLDVGAGDGNLALAAARRGATVQACDLAPAMVERGRERSEGYEIGWRVADAQELPYPDGEFDAVLSTFGASEAPRAERAASELARVARPGGIVAMTAWVPRGLQPPADWGVQSVARARLESLLDELQLLTRTVQLCFPSPDSFFDSLLLPYPLGPRERDSVRLDLEQVLASCNNRPPEVEVDARYLVIMGRRAP